jgi:hypothetical protein
MIAAREAAEPAEQLIADADAFAAHRQCFKALAPKSPEVPTAVCIN